MLVLHRQERTAIGILLLVTVFCLAGTLILDTIGKEQFTREYQANLPDGTLVRWDGIVGSISYLKGGNTLLEVSGVRVFVPTSAGEMGDITPGAHIRIIGTIQHWNGKEEIIVQTGSDISILS